jgi:hypothetical protein
MQGGTKGNIMPDTKAIDPTIPAPPAFLSAKTANVWRTSYAAALAQAKVDLPGNERAQRIAALKAANKLFSVPAPTSAADVDKLEPWQKLKDVTVVIDGVATRVCVTSDGRKYSFAIDAATDSTPNLQAMNKAEIVAHALDVHGLTLDPGLKKDDLIAAVAAKHAQ